MEKLKFNVKSDIGCEVCGKKIKQNLVDRKFFTPKVCFKHWPGKSNTASEIRAGKVIGRKGGKYNP